MQYEVKGVKKEKNVKVIDQVLGEKVFPIGHSDTQSMTFVPIFKKDPSSDLMFGDLAGLSDSDGEFISLINALTSKYII